MALTYGALASAVDALPEPVRFASRDGATELVGYLFRPAGPGPHPAIVLLHGRSGPYSSLAKGIYDAGTLSLRHAWWGRFWAQQGYVALLVDSFGPRGYPAGFGRSSYASRPTEVSDQTNRPLDAYGALAYLRSRSDVVGDRVGVQGWSNKAMTILAALDVARFSEDARDGRGFRAGLALYPGCRVQEGSAYVPYAPLLMLLGSADEEVSPVVCEGVARQVAGRTDRLTWFTYPGAQHDFDNPGRSRQAVPANRAATEDARVRALQFFDAQLR
jgi:carboxymethylenebutenolidase